MSANCARHTPFTKPMNAAENAYCFKYRPFAEALYHALVDDGFYATLERSVTDPAVAREAMFRYLDYSMREAEQYGELHIPAAQPVGASVWAKPLEVATAEAMKAAKIRFLREHMGTASERAYLDIVAFMSAQTRSLVDERCWYLSILGILPEYQNRGLGAGLVTPVLEISDRLGIPTYLETFTPRNEPFYQRLGYARVGSFFEPTIGASYAVMIRPPERAP